MNKNNERLTIDTNEYNTNSKKYIISTINKNKVNRVLDFGTEKTKYDTKYIYNTEKPYTNNKENISLNSHNYNNSYDDNSSLRKEENYSINSNYKNAIDTNSRNQS